MTSTDLGIAAQIAPAAAPHAALVAAARDVPLTAPTPCGDWDLRALLNHLLYWTPILAATGRRVAAEPAAPSEQEVDLVVADWPAALAASRADLVAAWSDPAAWTGTVSVGGPDELPAPMIGGMVLGELVVHGWDLGRAVGREPQWPADVLAAAHEAMLGMAEQGREMGLFGPEVAVPAGASTLDRLLAASGREPGWTP
ncbi:TIGR03086 family metal-binding protein [Pseudonocardia nigra]|uniref:TIGR03086 family metal-binding protein n=1 Tax=Pseudonocardia nigra TaxID=1921578 RepID=UPI001C5E77F9|nr:TIGR03086 family metal-binding protein [Pseudonocardia nigra]